MIIIENINFLCISISLTYLVLSSKKLYAIKYYKYYKTYVLVKVSNPTNSQIQRYITWQNSMKNSYRFEVLSDKSLKIPNIFVNIIYPEELFRKWPKMLQKGGRCKCKKNSFAMWISIVEHYILCVKKSKYRYKYLWMVEQDLGYSGNLYEFMKSYEKNDVDVILQKYINQSTLFWPKCYTHEYYNWIKKYHYNYKYQSYNWITRLSKRAVDLLYNEFELGRHVFNEQSIPERIFPLNMSYKFLNSSYNGYKYSWNTRITADEWKNILKNPLHKNKLFHALKF